jgi:hypothetical protein
MPKRSVVYPKISAKEIRIDGPAGLSTMPLWPCPRAMFSTCSVISDTTASAALKATTSGALVKPKMLEVPSGWVVV